jgi:hypothetical protein
MGIQFQAICDVIQTLALSARDIADDYFTRHVRIAELVADGHSRHATTRRALVASDAIGREQQRQLSKLLDDLDRVSGSTWFSAALRNETRACRDAFCENSSFRDFPQNHNAAFRDATAKINQIACAMPDDTPGEVLLVPDTASILDSPALESWALPPFQAFNLFLPESLLCELEELRNSALDQATWKKCTAAIGQLQEYRRRGSWDQPLVLSGDGTIALSVRPLGPVFDDAVSWLDPESPVDRIVARVVSVVRDHPRCVVALVTQDAKLQDRADDTRIDTIRPPTPPGQHAFD